LASCPSAFIAKLLAGAADAEALEETIDELTACIAGGEAGLGGDGVVDESVAVIVFAVALFYLGEKLLVTG
jgi:hypothetical protein